jgi:hypothetical protein
LETIRTTENLAVTIILRKKILYYIANSGEGIVNPSGAPEFTPIFVGF